MAHGLSVRSLVVDWHNLVEKAHDMTDGKLFDMLHEQNATLLLSMNSLPEPIDSPWSAIMRVESDYRDQFICAYRRV